MHLDPVAPVQGPVQTQLCLSADVLVITVIFIRANTEICLAFGHLSRVRQSRLIDVDSYASSVALTMGRARQYKQSVWSSFITLNGSTSRMSTRQRGPRRDVAQRFSVTQSLFTVTD